MNDMGDRLGNGLGDENEKLQDNHLDKKVGPPLAEVMSSRFHSFNPRVSIRTQT
jgi:hypothetical protein